MRQIRTIILAGATVTCLLVTACTEPPSTSTIYEPVVSSPRMEEPAVSQPRIEEPAVTSPQEEVNVDDTRSGDTAEPPAVGLPAVLVGTWNGDDADGVGSWYLTFASDGSFRFENERRAAHIAGSAAVSGSVLTLRPVTGEAFTMMWSVDGGRLTLDGQVYLRTDGAAGDSSSLVGAWLSTSDTYATLTFHQDGSFQLADPVNGNATGSFSVNGSRLSLQAGAQTNLTLAWSVRDGVLTLQWPNGEQAQYVRAG